MKVTIELDGKKYEGELAEVVDGGSQQKNESQNDLQEGGKRMKKMKKVKGTRKLSPYMKFAQQARKEVLAENPSLKSDVIAVGRKIGEKWRALSDAEKAKY
jgi:hypothetical protein